MSKAFPLVGFLVLLAACAGQERIRTVEVDIPVPVIVRCEVKIPPRLELPLAKLEPGSPPADTIRAYASTVALLKGSVIAREILLAACAHLIPNPGPSLKGRENSEEGKGNLVTR